MEESATRMVKVATLDIIARCTSESLKKLRSAFPEGHRVITYFLSRIEPVERRYSDPVKNIMAALEPNIPDDSVFDATVRARKKVDDATDGKDALVVECDKLQKSIQDLMELKNVEFMEILSYTWVQMEEVKAELQKRLADDLDPDVLVADFVGATTEQAL